MTRQELIDGLEIYTVGRLKKSNVHMTVEELQNFIDKIKELEQEPYDDIMAIHTQGLAEGIRCAMCTNSRKSNRGCDGGCVFNENMYKEVMNTIENHIVPLITPTQEPSEDAVSRKDIYFKLTNGAYPNETIEQFIDRLVKELEASPSVTLQPKVAQWISKGDVYPAWKYCSNCKEPWTFDCGLPNYCPVCGAKMKSEIPTT